MKEYLYDLDENGFVTKYLYSGRKETVCNWEGGDSNQLRYEKYLRSRVAEHAPIVPDKDICIGRESVLGLPWKYFYSHGNCFLNVSAFYNELRRVDLVAATVLTVSEDMEVSAHLWSCDAMDLWVNGNLVGGMQAPVYKPVRRQLVRLPLKKGENDLYIRLETLGVRDTSIAFAIQLLEQRDKIKVALTDAAGAVPFCEAESILDSAVLKEGKLRFDRPLPQESRIVYDKEMPDFCKRASRFLSETVSGKQEIDLKEYASFRVEIMIGGQQIGRRFERIELRNAVYLNRKDGDPQDIYREIGKITSLTRDAADGFALYPMLARYYEGKRTNEDRDELNKTLEQIERRMDCADFMTCALIRFLKNYGMELKYPVHEKIKEVMLNFRYWMDDEGQDGMCFWSENHSLMFYQTAYFFGMEYPDNRFVRSGKTGRELAEEARRRIHEWLDDVCEYGFDEFNSGTYTPITFSAILNLVDYAEPGIANKAQKAADLLIRMMAVHCFRNVVISPQGRIYRDVLYPHRQALQSLVNFIRPDTPYVYNEWLISMATSSYRIPEDAEALMDCSGAYTYQTGNAVVDLYKTDNYMLTSVQSPRRDGVTRVWERDEEDAHNESFLYVKSWNECFHGTTQFEPGVLGYQQHLWYAALDTELVIFVNHPGGFSEDMSEMRPGYWYGNGVIPALLQDKNVLAAVYVIPEDWPVHFTHLFWNEKKFTETSTKDGWLFGRKENSYIGIWCSKPYVDYNDVLFDCEKRSYGDKIAYLCVCGSRNEHGDFEQFQTECLTHDPWFDETADTLISADLTLVWKKHSNSTQYMD